MPNVLANLFSWADGVKRRASSPLQTIALGLQRGTEDLKEMGRNDDIAYGLNGMKSVLISDAQKKEAAQKAAEFGLNMGMAGATVWHGSPHKFDKFDSSKIGTGEGAQAYGHGLYLAESPAVAGQYQKTLSADGFLVGDKVFDPSALGHLNVRSVARSGDLNAAIAKAQEIAGSNSPVASMAANDLKVLLDAKAAGGLQKNSGSLYKVDLPDNAIARMLDWDKPLQEQAGLLEQLGAKLDQTRLGNELGVYKGKLPTAALGGSASYGSKSQPATGADLYRRIAGSQWAKENPAQASEMLRGAGVPGIRYLDGGSRGAGQGSSNYVVFPGQEDILKILERNGVPTK